MATEEPEMPSEPLVTAKNVDLLNCDREQVAFPGAIQPHGVLLVLREPELEVLQVSANVPSFLGVSAEQLIGQDLSGLFGEQQMQALALCLETAALDGPPERLMRLRQSQGTAPKAQDFEVYAHRKDGVLILELEEVVAKGPTDSSLLYGEVRRCVARLRAAGSLEDFFDVLAREVRAMTGFDRVDVYQFMDDLSGLVRAESLTDGLAPYLGLRFPATDVPEPARRLLSRLWLRHQPDAAYEPVPLVPELNPLTGQPLDLSHAQLRSTSPLCNRFYLNMGVRANFILTLLKDGELWGFIGCLHSQPRVVPHETRAACESLAHMVSFLVAAKEDADQAADALAAKAAAERVIEAMAAEELYQLGLLRAGISLTGCVSAQGAAVLVGEGVSLLGDTPGEEPVLELAAWLDAQPDIFHTDRLAEVCPLGTGLQAVASGLLAIRLPEHSGYLMWFRPEQVEEVQWAGDPVKPVEVDERSGMERLGPRRSFEVWVQKVHGRSRAWLGYQIEAAARLLQAMCSLHRAERLNVANQSLAYSNEALIRGNEELESFAFTAAHDLKEPLRGIGWNAARLQQDFGGAMNQGGHERLERIAALSRRMDGLIDALLNYSRLSRLEGAPCAVDVGEVVREVLDALQARIDASAAEVQVQPGMPTLRGDPVQLREVFLNLISNALKYNDSHLKRVEVGMLPSEEPVFFVKDNGIGIAPQYQSTIFGIFRRLHGRDSYGGGLGAGLAIAKKMIERQGGRIWVESAPGAGSTFFFSVTGSEQGEGG